MSEITFQFKLHKFMTSKQRGISEGIVAISPGLVTRMLICISMYGTIVSLKQGQTFMNCLVLDVAIKFVSTFFADLLVFSLTLFSSFCI